MSYRKSKQSRTRRNQAHRPPGRLQVYGGAARQLFNDVMYLKSIINSELHYLDVIQSNNLDYNGVVHSLSTIPVGDGPTDRTGLMVLPRGIDVRGFTGLTISGASAGLTIKYRVILFQYWGDPLDSSSTPSPGDILQYTGASTSVFSPLNDDITGPPRDRARKIRVLADRLEVHCPYSHTATSLELHTDVNPVASEVKEHIKFYDTSTTAPISGGIFILLMSDQVTGTYTQYGFTSRLQFYDN